MSSLKSLSQKQQALLAERARCMRHHPTSSEARLWSAIRGGRLGVRFQRQVVIGRFICDFVAPSARLIVEVDGGYHCRRQHADQQRELALERSGYRIVRVSERLVETQLAQAVAIIRQALVGTG